MLTEIHTPFTTPAMARKALRAMRKQYRVALRGSVVIGSKHWDGVRVTEYCPFRLHVNLNGSGFSSAEFASAVEWMARNGELCATT